MRDFLLRGRLRHGLYALDVSLVPQVFSGVRVSSTHWHARLGHHATPIVRHVLQRHVLPVVFNKTVTIVCDACQQGKSHQLSFLESSRVVKTPQELVFLMYVGMPKLLLMFIITMSILLMLTVVSLGFILLSANLLCLMFSYNSKHMLSVSLSIKL